MTFGVDEIPSVERFGSGLLLSQSSRRFGRSLGYAALRKG